MENNIKEYMKYYIGCEIKIIKKYPVFETNGIRKLLYVNVAKKYAYYTVDGFTNAIAPILRKLSSLTKEEKCTVYDLAIGENKATPEDKEAEVNLWMSSYNSTFGANEFHYLISLGIWLFGDEYFDAGLIIDSVTLKS